MVDYNSTAKAIAAEIGCSMATVNMKAKKLGMRLKGRSPEEHGRLMEALKSVKPRTPKAAAKKKASTPRKKAAPSVTGDITSFLNQGKAHVVDLRRRIASLDKEKAQLQEVLDKLLVLFPEKR